ncbi:gelation factor-like isoform X2 [Bolinopsis microptera]|uniref:gelation factor-like isoform X2 n=1 Tax=Bolinopsis microptera TaxID=2820187 RepID=UPI003079246A
MDPRTRDQLETWRRKRNISGQRGISTIRKTEMKWVQIQHRTFAKWVSQHTGSKIENFKVDFIDGTIFLRLMEVLAGKSVKRYHMFPQSITQRCDNVQLALDICSSEDVKLTNIGAQDIAGGSLKLILGLVWCLIQRYHLTSICDKRVGGSGGPGLKNNLIRGLNKVLDKVKLRVNNIRDDWRDGMALTALVTYLAPAFNRDFMNIERGDYISATDDAMTAAQAHLNIPRLLSAEDFTSDEVDELSMITYLSYFLDPVHKSVRETYLKEHPEYVPLYKPYIEPEVPEETKPEKESPIKKLFSSYKEKLKKVRPSIADTKFYKEPYQIDSKERLSGSKERLSANNGSVGSPKNQGSISSSEPYQTFSRSKESLLLDRRTPSPSSISSRVRDLLSRGQGLPDLFFLATKKAKLKPSTTERPNRADH